MATKKSRGTGEQSQKINRQFILEHLSEKEIDLSMCNLLHVPVKELASVSRGSHLDLSRNLFTALPDNFGTLKHLIELDLSSNQLTLLPDSISQLALLQKLDLYGNKLTTLPLTFWHLKKLKWLDLRNNRLEPGLAEAAGPCVSETECKQCASKVLVYMKQKSADHERRRQLELQREREEQKRLAEEERLRQEEARKQKALLRQRKREEYLRMEKERAAAKFKEEQEQNDEFVRIEKKINDQEKSSRSSGCSYVGVLCLAVVSVVLLLLFLLLGSYVYCNRLESPNQICFYWRTYILREKEKWTEQLMKFLSLS